MNDPRTINVTISGSSSTVSDKRIQIQHADHSHPMLESGNPSFPKGRYHLKFRRGEPCVVEHRIENAALIERLLGAGLAQYACVVSSPISSYRRTHVSDDARHEVGWHSGDLGAPPLFTPMIFCVESCTITVDSDRDGVHRIWNKRRVDLQKGSRLALGNVIDLSSSESVTCGPVKRLNDMAYAMFREELLREKGSERQREFLGIVRDTSAFLDHMAAIETEGVVDPMFARRSLTENEYKDPPSSTEQALYAAWTALTPSVACRSTFWAHLTIRHIRAGRIQSAYLAAAKRGGLSGAERIDFALGETNKQGAKQIDACVRTVLRNLGGLPEVRGNRSVYVDCPLARAWWRERFVVQVAGGDARIASGVRAVLRTNQTYWERLVARIVSKNSILASENIRSAFLRALARYVQTNPATKLTKPIELHRLCRRIEARHDTRELGILSETELDELMGVVVAETDGLAEREGIVAVPGTSWERAGWILNLPLAAAAELHGAKTLTDVLSPEFMRLAGKMGVADKIGTIRIGDVTGGTPGLVSAIMNRLSPTLDAASEAERIIVEQRLLRIPRTTLREIGLRVGVSRERIRQLQVGMESKVRDALGKERWIVASVLKEQLGSAVSRDEADRRIKEILPTDGNLATRLLRKTLVEDVGLRLDDGMYFDNRKRSS